MDSSAFIMQTFHLLHSLPQACLELSPPSQKRRKQRPEVTRHGHQGMAEPSLESQGLGYQPEARGDRGWKWQSRGLFGMWPVLGAESHLGLSLEEECRHGHPATSQDTEI